MSKGNGPLAALAVLVVVAMVLSSAGCIVEEDEPTPDANKVPDDRKDARLVVDGAVQTPLNWSLQQVVDLGLVDFKANTTTSVGGTLEGNFSGVRLKAVLDAAKVNSSADILEFEASDGYVAVVYRSDLGPDTFLAVKEEGEWSPLESSGALRLVSTSLSSQQWVKLVVAVHARVSQPLAVTGLANRTGTVSAGWVHSNGDVTVSWTEGTKNRNAKGLALADVLDEVQADMWWGTTVVLKGTGTKSAAVNAVDALAAGKDHIAADAKGKLVYVSDGVLLLSDLRGIDVSAGLQVRGEVGHLVNMTAHAVRAIPPRAIDDAGTSWTGAALEAVVAEAGPDATVNATEVIARDGSSLVVTAEMWQNATVAYQRGGVDLGADDGYLVIVVDTGSGVQRLEGVVRVRAFTQA